MTTPNEVGTQTSLDLLNHLRKLFEIPRGVYSLDLHLDGNDAFPQITIKYEPHAFIKHDDYVQPHTRRYILIPVDQHDASASQQRQ